METDKVDTGICQPEKGDIPLGLRQNEDSSDSVESLRDLVNPRTKKGKSSSLSSSVSVDVVYEPKTKTADEAQDMDVPVVTERRTHMYTSTLAQEGLLYNDEVCQSEFMVVTHAVETSKTQQPDAPFGGKIVPEHRGCLTTENNGIGLATNAPVQVEYVADLPFMPVHSSSSNSPPVDIPTEFLDEDLLARAAYASDVIQFGKLPSDGTELDKTLPCVSEITVHRGLVCRDLINFFSQEENRQTTHSTTTFEMNMLKEDGTPEVAEDNDGVMRDALTEFWDTFYLQYTEGNIYKVPVLRHDMTDVQWKAVVAVIRMGFNQEGVFPIKLAPSFMQQATFGACDDADLLDSDLLDSFLKFVSVMDKTVFETALKDFESVEEDDINDVMEQYGAKKLINADNVDRIVREIAHKEFVQKPMFVADCFYKLLHTTSLVQEDMSVIYAKLQPSPKKVLKSLRFPEEMSQAETTLSLHVKKLVREMDDPQYLGLFL